MAQLVAFETNPERDIQRSDLHMAPKHGVMQVNDSAMLAEFANVTRTFHDDCANLWAEFTHPRALAPTFFHRRPAQP
jgi:hypothetical protein